MVGPPSVRPAAPSAHLFDRPGHVGRRQVVEQHAVGQLAGQGQHAGVEGAEHDLGASLAQPHPEAEAVDLVVVAVEGHRLARQALRAAG